MFGSATLFYRAVALGLSHEDKGRLIDALFARLNEVEAKLGVNSETPSKASHLMDNDLFGFST